MTENKTELLPDVIFSEMERRFKLPKDHDDYMQNDDTQIGVEFVLDYIAKTTASPELPADKVVMLDEIKFAVLDEINTDLSCRENKKPESLVTQTIDILHREGYLRTALQQPGDDELVIEAQKALDILDKEGHPGWGVAKDILRAAIYKAKAQ